MSLSYIFLCAQSIFLSFHNASSFPADSVLVILFSSASCIWTAFKEAKATQCSIFHIKLILLQQNCYAVLLIDCQRNSNNL